MPHRVLRERSLLHHLKVEIEVEIEVEVGIEVEVEGGRNME